MSPQEAEAAAEFDREVAFMYGFAKAAKDAGLNEEQYVELCKVAAEMTGAPTISGAGVPAITNTAKPAAPAPAPAPAPVVAPKPQFGAATSDFGVDPNTPTTDFMKQLEAQQKKTGAALRIELFKLSAAGPVQPLPPPPSAGPVPQSPSQGFISQLLAQKLKSKPAPT